TESAVGYATSADGITWTFYDDPATTSPPYQSSDPVLNHGIPGEWDASSAIEPSVIKTKCGYEVWYIGGVQAEGTHQYIGYAFSVIRKADVFTSAFFLSYPLSRRKNFKDL